MNIDRTVNRVGQYYHKAAIGHYPHDMLSRDQLELNAQYAWRSLATRPAQTLGKHVLRSAHAYGLEGAKWSTIPAMAVTFPLDVVVGTGRLRPAEGGGQNRHACGQYIRGMLNHPLDTGMLGLWGGYSLAQRTLFVGSVACILGIGIGVLAWPVAKSMTGASLTDTVRYCRDKAVVCAAFVALAQSLLVVAPDNLVILQIARLATSVPKLVAALFGYATMFVYGALMAVSEGLSAGIPRFREVM